jgi:hypothetical protein
MKSLALPQSACGKNTHNALEHMAMDIAKLPTTKVGSWLYRLTFFAKAKSKSLTPDAHIREQHACELRSPSHS